ncbi:phage holin family protein [Amphritea sp. HPY]|uniref:phage holin family protein n=1 Tax=Amphritea sp. HPY TaxID=3421652 RepID=UPI003D7CA06A
MPEKDPTTYSLITYLWVLGISSMGGIANYVRRVKAGTAEKFSIMEVVGEIFISGFTGLITFWFCESADIDPLLTAALVGISGHMGSRAIALFEHEVKRRWGVRE